MLLKIGIHLRAVGENARAAGTTIPSSLLNMQPYLLTLLVVIAATIIVRTKHIGTRERREVSSLRILLDNGIINR